VSEHEGALINLYLNDRDAREYRSLCNESRDKKQAINECCVHAIFVSIKRFSCLN
jgi:hypothetical protein